MYIYKGNFLVLTKQIWGLRRINRDINNFFQTYFYCSQYNTGNLTLFVYLRKEASTFTVPGLKWSNTYGHKG